MEIKNYIIEDSSIHLCDGCIYSIDDCPANNVFFGDIIGMENVIACDGLEKN